LNTQTQTKKQKQVGKTYTSLKLYFIKLIWNDFLPFLKNNQDNVGGQTDTTAATTDILCLYFQRLID